MRKMLVLMIALLLTSCTAQQAKSPSAEEWRAESPSWQMVSTDPRDFSITYDGFPDLDDWPLDKLVAYCLGSDGIYAEEGFDQLYQYFLEAPHTCVSYFALIQDDGQRDILCSHIAAIEADWYGGTQEFQEIIIDLAKTYPDGVEASLIQSLRNEEK